MDQLKELINTLLMVDTLLLSCVVGLAFNYGYSDYVEVIERFAKKDEYATVAGVSEEGYAKMMDNKYYKVEADSSPWFLVERFARSYVLSFAMLGIAVLILILQYLSITFTSFHKKDGSHSAKQAEAHHGVNSLPRRASRRPQVYWRFAFLPCFVATCLSVTGTVWSLHTVYELFVAVMPNKYAGSGVGSVASTRVGGY